MLLNNQQIIEEVKKEIKICIEMNDNENTTTQILWDTIKAVLRGRVIALYAYLKKQEKKQEKPQSPPLKLLPSPPPPGPSNSPPPPSLQRYAIQENLQTVPNLRTKSRRCPTYLRAASYQNPGNNRTVQR